MNELLRDNNRLYTNMIRDIYSLGSVLERKFRLLRTSYTIFMVGLIAGVTLFIIVYLGVVLVGPPARPGLPI
jgi:membrane associated rhomboid family serine protease